MGDDKTMPERIWADRSDDDLPQYADTPFGIWWHGHRDGYTRYTRDDIHEAETARLRAERDAAVEVGVKAALKAVSVRLHDLCDFDEVWGETEHAINEAQKAIRALDPAEIAARTKGGDDG